MTEDQARQIIALLTEIEFPAEGIAELIEAAKDIVEFYESKANFNPPPLPEQEEIILKL